MDQLTTTLIEVIKIMDETGAAEAEVSIEWKDGRKRKIKVIVDDGAEEEWKGPCGAIVYEGERPVGACGVMNCQTHKV